MNVLLTGGSSGLGRAIVERLSLNPDNTVYFTYNSNESSARSLTDGHENRLAIKCNFESEADVSCLVEKIESLDLDVLINNAYVGPAVGKHFHKTPVEAFEATFRVNVLPTVRITQSAIQTFKTKKRGKIITVLTAYLVNLPPMGVSAYTANKAYLQQLSKSWNAEYSSYNITSNCISPDFMITNLSSGVDERILQQMTASHPLKRLLTPAEVADSVDFLVNTSQQVNGINLVINAAKNVL